MSTIKNSNKKNKDIPQNKKVAKPWGSEYSIYRNKIAIYVSRALQVYINL